MDLVEGDREVLVGGVHVLDRRGEHLFVGRTKQHVGALAVFEAEQVVAVFGPAVGELVWFAWKKGWEQQLLCAHGVHFFTDDAFDLAQGAKPKWEPVVNARRGAADVACSDEQFVAWNFGIGWVFAQRAQEEL